MASIIVVSIALAWASVIAGENAVPACNSLKPATFDYQWLMRSSPLNFYRSTIDIFQCGKAVFLGPAGDSTSYTGSAVVIRGNYTLTYDYNITDNSLIKTLLCSNGIKKDYQTVYANTNSPSASICVVSCNQKDGTKYDAIVCGGRTSEDERDIEQFLNTKLKGVKGISNSQKGCNKPQYCNTFTN